MDAYRLRIETGSNPVLTTNVIRLTAKNGINEEYHKWLQTLMVYKWVNSIITLNSQVVKLVNTVLGILSRG